MTPRKLSPKEASALLDFLVEKFNIEGLKDLCFRLGIDFENLPHSVKRQFARELILHCERRNELANLIQEVIKANPQDVILQIAAQWIPLEPRIKHQFVIRGISDNIPSKEQIRLDLAATLTRNGIPTQPEDIELIVGAKGSLRALISLLPKVSKELSQVTMPLILESKYLVSSAVSFEKLSEIDRNRWKVLARDSVSWPPKAYWIPHKRYMSPLEIMVVWLIVGGSLLLTCILLGLILQIW